MSNVLYVVCWRSLHAKFENNWKWVKQKITIVHFIGFLVVRCIGFSRISAIWASCEGNYAYISEFHPANNSTRYTGALISKRRRRIDTSRRPLRRKGQTNSRAFSARPSILLPPSDTSFSFSHGPSCPVLSNALRRCSCVHTSTLSPPPPTPTPPLRLRACALSRAKRPHDLLSSLHRASSFSPLPIPPFRRFKLLPLSATTLPPLAVSFSHPTFFTRGRALTRAARAMGEKEHGWHMQNVATSIFHAGLFAEIYDAAIGILLLRTYLPTMLFLCVLFCSSLSLFDAVLPARFLILSELQPTRLLFFSFSTGRIIPRILENFQLPFHHPPTCWLFQIRRCNRMKYWQQ